MRSAPFLLTLALASTCAAASEAFLDRVCRLGFSKTTMPKSEAARFCACVVEDVSPRLSASQRTVLQKADLDLTAGSAPSEQALSVSGVKDLVVAGQARCEASFYPPSAPLLIISAPMEVTLRCDDEKHGVEAFVYLRNINLLTKAELAAVDKRMMKDDFKPDFAKVTMSFDGKAPTVQRWEIDLTGQIVSPPDPAKLLERLRNAKAIDVTVERGSTRIARNIPLTGKIPVRWVPCTK
jgi:hypothetical protein